MRKVRRRKNHMNIMVLNEENQIEIVHVPNHLADEYIRKYNLMTIQTKDEIYDFLLDHNSLKVK
jgi:adenylate cyclase